MSNTTKWDVSIMRKIAGLTQVTESVDEDDEDPDARIAMKDRRQAAFERRNKNDLSSAAKEADLKDKVSTAKASEPKVEKKDAPKTEPKTEKTSDKPDELNAGTRGRKPDDGSKRGQARAWLSANPTAPRKEFMAHATSFGMSPAYASAFRASHNTKTQVSECYVLSHPSMPSFLLAENREMNQMQWVDLTSPLDPMIFASKAEAEKVVKYMGEWKSQYVNIDTIKFED